MDQEMAIVIRAIESGDYSAVCGLVNRDHPFGQPEATVAQLEEALAGKSPIDAFYWERLSQIRTKVATCGGKVVGAASLGIQADGVRFLLWLHADGNAAVVEALRIGPSYRI